MNRHEPSYAVTVAYRIATIALILSALFTLNAAVQLASGGDGDVAFSAVLPADERALRTR